jgi:hypothetical protein
MRLTGPDAMARTAVAEAGAWLKEKLA